MAYTGSNFDATGASVTIGGTELAGGGTTQVSLTERFDEQELLCYGNYPDPAITEVRKYVEGSVNWIMDSAADFPAAANTGVTLVIDSDGLYFTGSVRITDVTVGLGVDGNATASFNFKTVNQTYILANASV